jgi:hypothetical protein
MRVDDLTHMRGQGKRAVLSPPDLMEVVDGLLGGFDN